MSSSRRRALTVIVEYPSAEATRGTDNTSLGDFDFDDVFTYGDTPQQRRSADHLVKPQLKVPRTVLYSRFGKR